MVLHSLLPGISGFLQWNQLPKQRMPDIPPEGWELTYLLTQAAVRVSDLLECLVTP